MQQIAFKGRILVLGCGGVARCTLPLLLRHLDMPRDRITVLDMADYRPLITDVLQAGVNYVREKITRQKYRKQLERFVGPGDMIIDLAWNLGCTDLLDWCHQHDVLYINTSVELWNPYAGAADLPTTDRTLYTRHMDIRGLVRGWENRPGSTAILDHGANPGLVSHFTRLGLLDIGRRIVETKPRDPRVPTIETAMAEGAFNRLAQAVGVKVIHISERDTQVTNRPKQPDEFVNTWSVEGFYEEAIAPAEMGWGTHEGELPPDACLHNDDGPKNQICLERFGMNTFVRSRVPSGEIKGMVIRHGEAFSISEVLSVLDDAGAAVYRPTVHYAYHPCDTARESISEMRLANYELQTTQRTLSDDIIRGQDELGCLLMGHDFKSWWTGSILNIDEARSLVPGQNATTLQVAASVVSAVCWMIRNPKRGVLLPDQLPHDEIMKIARPYLGRLISQEIDWMPVASVRGKALSPSDDEAWQFGRFLLPRTPRGSSRRHSRASDGMAPFPKGAALPANKAAAVFRRDRSAGDLLVDTPE